jgi:hypothetical protein
MQRDAEGRREEKFWLRLCCAAYLCRDSYFTAEPPSYAELRREFTDWLVTSQAFLIYRGNQIARQ